MGIFGIAKKGFGLLGKKNKGLRSSGTGAIKSVKPGVGGLKVSSTIKEGIEKSVAEGVRKFGRPHTNKVLSGLKGKKTMGSIIKQGGDIERKRKGLLQRHPALKGKLKK
jgi:hypothetical protein|tara:strand:- start:594 stop:920 length:327 start_codon:yes stop_codon:yes gene_type:complete